MIVKTLIEKLSKFPEDAEVLLVRECEGDGRGTDINVVSKDPKVVLLIEYQI